MLESAFQRPALLISDAWNALRTAPERCAEQGGGGASACMSTRHGIPGSLLAPVVGQVVVLVLPRRLLPPSCLFCRPNKEQELLAAIMATLRGDGSVLIPIDTGAADWQAAYCARGGVTPVCTCRVVPGGACIAGAGAAATSAPRGLPHTLSPFLAPCSGPSAGAGASAGAVLV